MSSARWIVTFHITTIEIFLVISIFLSGVSLQSVVRHPSDVTVKVDEDVTLVCTFDSVEPNQTLVWYKDNTSYAFDEFVTNRPGDNTIRVLIEIDRNQGEYNITFTAVVIDDNGLYKCGAHNDSTYSYIWSNEAKLTVPVNFDEQPSDTSVVEGETVQLQCRVNVMPTGGHMIWQKDEIVITYNYTVEGDYDINRVYVQWDNVTGEYNLTISNFTLNDIGVYRCGVKFENGFYHWSENAELTLARDKTTTTSVTMTTRSRTTSDVVILTSEEDTKTTTASSVSTSTPLVKTTNVPTTITMTTASHDDPTTTVSKLTTTDDTVTSRTTSTRSPSTQPDVITSSTVTNTEPVTETQTWERDTTTQAGGITNKPTAGPQDTSRDDGIELWIIIVAIVIGLLALIAVVVILLIISSRVRKQRRLKKTEEYSPNEESLERVAMKLKAAGFENPVFPIPDSEENETQLNDSNDFRTSMQIEGQEDEIVIDEDLYAQPLKTFNSNKANKTETDNNIQNEEPLVEEMPQVPIKSADLLVDTKDEADNDSTQNDTQSCEDNTVIEQNVLSDEEDSQLTSL